MMFCANWLESYPIIAVDSAPDGTNFPWFFPLNVTWGEFWDRCRQCANMHVDVEGLCSFLCKTRMSWIPLFDHPWSSLNASANLPVPEKSFVLRLPAQAQENAGKVAGGEEEAEEGARRGEGEGDEDDTGMVTGGDEGEGNGLGGSEGGGEAGAGQKDEDGTKSEVPFSVMPETLGMAEKASDEAGSKHRLADVFPLTVAGDSVVHAHENEFLL